MQTIEPEVVEDKLSSVVLTHLSLEHHVPLFQKAGIDLDKFLSMSEPDFQRLGLDDPRDLGLLSTCSKALSVHLQRDVASIESTTTHSIPEVDEDDDDDTPLLTPSSILNAIHAFDSYPKKSSLSPPAIVVIPSVQTNTSSAHDYSTSAAPPMDGGLLLPSSTTTTTTVNTPRPRFNKQVNTRPVSMPVQLPSFTTPPPDYEGVPSIYGKRMDRCRSMIFPREEEGKEELPAYSCTVFKMGYVHVKKEFDTPGVKSRYRGWRKLYVELWGTVLRVYRTAPTETSCTIDYNNYYRWPLRTPYSYYHRYYYTPILTLSLAGAEASRALDYFRRPNALRLTTPQGPQLLLRMNTHVEMISWVEHLQAGINISLDLELRPMPKFITIPNRSLTTAALDPRSIELERAREQRRRDQREVLI
ncbi:hypothetical protein INT47_002903 [Mucor saturninus]|uniref:PH domain-containing protein n=1 Tax=Mucor saturninus TaxID=64648 RepID=A0A8H7QNQ3_9FUNG|nr:hypothetical protein INT47_002903 [Mucor saturninus]